MASNVPPISDDAALQDAAAKLARSQLRSAAAIVAEVTGRDIDETDTQLVAAMVQALAVNRLTLVIQEGTFLRTHL